MRQLLPFLFICFLSLGIQAQRNIQSNASWLDAGQIDAPEEYFMQNREALKLSEGTAFKMVNEIPSQSGMQHIKYKQTYKGLDVLGGILIQHLKSGKLQSVNGYYWKNLDLDVQPALTEETAIELARQFCFYQLTKKMSRTALLQVNMKHKAMPRLAIADRQFPAYSGKTSLVWVVDISYDTEIPNIDRVLVDAKSGDVISRIPRVMSENIEVEVQTKYIGLRTITIDSLAEDDYRLSDDTRGGGIATIDGYQDDLYKSRDKYDWFIYEKEFESAQDAHYAMQAYYDLLRDSFQFNSIDNAGKRLESYIHPFGERSFLNAFWTGDAAFFGDGTCDGYGPLTSLDVVGHEFTHGLTQLNSGLVYSGDPGGMNEAMSDIFGKALEYINDRENFTWDIGRAFILDNEKEPFRSMKDPNLYHNPKYYHGRFWYDEVHNTSGILNYWFYLITEGEKGKNEKSVPYDVKGIGLDKALRIVFAMNTVYLTPTSTYPDGVRASLAAVKELFGEDGQELKSVKEAWKAVGLEPVEKAQNDLALKLEMEGIPSFLGYRVCAHEVLPLNLKIYNKGLDTIKQGTKLFLAFSNAKSNTGLIKLARDLYPGDSLSASIPDELDFSGKEGQVISVVARLIRKDDNTSNNKYSIQFYVLTNVAGKDLRVRRVTSEIIGCTETQDTNLTLFLTTIYANGGCENLQRGEKFYVTTTVNGEVYYDSSIIGFDLEPDFQNIVSFRKSVPLKAGVNDFSVSLSAPFDTDSGNNDFEGTFFLPLKIHNGYFEGFESFDIMTNPAIDISGRDENAALIQYNGSQYLAYTALFEIQNEDVDPCESVSRFFNSNRSVSSWTWCAATDPGPKGQAPLLEFDMVQFRTKEILFPGNPDYKSILNVSVEVDGELDSSYYFYGQEQGVKRHYAIPVPVSDNVIIQMRALTLKGSIEALNNGDFDKVDAVLIDNVRLGDHFVNTEPPVRLSSLNIFPNPVRDQVHFQLAESGWNGSELFIRSMTGRLVHHCVLTSGYYIWFVGENTPGTYFYTLYHKGARKAAGKIVVLK